MDSRPFNEQCPIGRAAEVFGDRCTLMILRDLFQDGTCRFSDFNARARGFSINTLSDRLKKLEGACYIEKSKYQEHPPRFEYRLTPVGNKLGKVIEAMYQWGKSPSGRRVLTRR